MKKQTEARQSVSRLLSQAKAIKEGVKKRRKAGQRSTREEVLMMILTFAMSVWYLPLVSLCPRVYSIDETSHGELTNGIYFQLPTIGGTGLFDVAY